MDGTTIKKIRLHLRDSQTQFANRFGVTRDAVAKWEAGKREPRLDKLDSLEQLYIDMLRELSPK